MFLQNVISDVLHSYAHTPPENLIFVVPNKRAVVFLKRYFAQQMNTPCQSPIFLSMSELVENISQHKTLPNMALLFAFYDVYKTHTETEVDDFETFMGWGQTILQDFNEIDQYLIDTQTIFPYIKAIKEVEHWSLSQELTTMQQKHLAFWNTLGSYYFAFREKLTAKNQGYRGLVYRIATEKIASYIEKSKEKVHIFAGFNALTKSEEHIIQEILLNLPSEMYWDIDQSFVKDEQHDAGLFMRSYFNRWKYYNNREVKWLHNDFSSKDKHINITGVPKSVNQAHFLGKCLKEIPQERWEHTAIILADENLLLPVLQSVDNQDFSLNITMGYPLKQTPFSDIFGAFLKLYLSNSWYHKDVENLLTQHIIQGLFSEDYIPKTLNAIREKNRVYITETHLHEFAQPEDSEILNILFFNTKNNATETIISNIFSLIFIIKKKLELNKDTNLLLLEYLYGFYQIFNQLQLLQKQYEFLTSPKVLYHLYYDLLMKQTLDFQGEPLQGLQLMGMLESQSLDFENIIIVSVNEGILPQGKTTNSFIPFDVKNHLGLPTYKHRDAIFTYHFYRLLQRAKNIHLIYNTESEALKGGEKSRFILQLTALQQDNLHITQSVLSPQVVAAKHQPITIQKEATIMKRLHEIASEKGFSPSSLSNYVRNPIDFYTQTILQIREQREVEETIEARTFGDIVHRTLEELYQPYIGKIITPEIIDVIKTKSTSYIEKNFKEFYKEEEYSIGKNLLIFNVIQEYIFKILEIDRELASSQTIEILALEEKMKVSIKLPKFDFPITFNGTADRIERRNGALYIVDYKTGKVGSSEVSMQNSHFGNLITDFKHSKAFQLLMYAYMVHKIGKYSDNELFAGIYSFKNLKEKFLAFGTKETPKGEKNKCITPQTLQQFEELLQTLLLEIFDQNTPFVEKELKK